MANLNYSSFIGGCPRSAEMKTSKDGATTWAEFSVGVAVGSFDEKRTMWVKCVAFGKLAGVVEKFVSKGAQVYVSGRIDVVPYTSKKWSQPMAAVSLVLSDFQIISKREASDETQVSATAASIPANYVVPTFESGLDDIPF